MIKRNSFEKTYPVFDKYIKNDNMRDNMLENSDLLRKYNAYQSLITEYVVELSNRFDYETVSKLIIDSILKFPDELMEALIVSYLASDEASKSNDDYLLYFKKISSYGADSIDYIKRNGLITNRNYRQIPNIVIDEKFKNLNTKPLFFKGKPISDTFYNLNYVEKTYLNNLIEKGLIGYLEQVFDDVNISLKYIIILLSNKNINNIMFTSEVINGLGKKEILTFSYMMFQIEYTAKIMECVDYLIKDSRFNLLKKIINYNLLSRIDEFSIDLLKEVDDDLVIEILLDKGFTLKKVED